MAPRNTKTIDGIPCRIIAGEAYLTYDDAAEYSGQAPSSFRNFVLDRKLQRLRFGRLMHVKKADLDQVLVGDRAA